jgi:transcription elongation GreA/GreB family factor
MTSVAWQSLEAELERLTAAVRLAAEGRSPTVAGGVGDTTIVHLPEPDALRRLGTLRAIAEQAVVGDEPGVAIIGRRVTIRDADGVETTYALVLPGDGDPTRGWVSADSPLGAAVTGRRAGDEVEVVAPAGSWRATVTGVA